MLSPADLLKNELLAKLREEDRKRLIPHLNPYYLKAGDIIQKAGDEVVDTWFPCEQSLAGFQVWVDDDNGSVEVAIIGREGAVGGIVSNGNVPAFATAQVRIGGLFLRVRTSALEHAKTESVALRHWFSRYSDCLIAQTFQTAACNATHTIVQRTAKWLLAAAARTGSREFALTHEQLAEMLGVGRTFVTRVARSLREEGIISTRRGVFVIEDATALKNKSCNCSAMIDAHFDTVLHGIYTDQDGNRKYG
ncbi:helix-turn-helix domain-containing protein [Pseudochelatococcus contaminans]|uniref:CRP-like cAMP-binding protein n=1 Tax=Pseudochelatococcus contaminans TaxID=1538103 RepID=A0A7W5Z1W0_9HYPH|nr:CRP-like cAMP-binding protein [Pseudochelatococcus contaminans]